MTFDRELYHNGIRWLRVKNGMGGRGDREDWVADVNHMTVSVHDYQFRPPYRGWDKYKSMTAAMDDQLRKGLEQLEGDAKKAQKHLKNVLATCSKMKYLKERCR